MLHAYFFLSFLLGISSLYKADVNLDDSQQTKPLYYDPDQSLYRSSSRDYGSQDDSKENSLPYYYNNNFDCSAHRYSYGMYADLDFQCQVYHVCHNNRKESFLCPKGTLFNQQILSCDHWYSVKCQDSANFYHLNDLLGKSSNDTFDGQGRPYSRRFPTGNRPHYGSSYSQDELTQFSERDKQNATLYGSNQYQRESGYDRNRPSNGLNSESQFGRPGPYSGQQPGLNQFGGSHSSVGSQELQFDGKQSRESFYDGQSIHAASQSSLFDRRQPRPGFQESAYDTQRTQAGIKGSFDRTNTRPGSRGTSARSGSGRYPYGRQSPQSGSQGSSFRPQSETDRFSPGRQPSQTGFGESPFSKPESQSGFSDSRPGSGRSPYGRQPSQTGFGESRFDKPESQSGFSDSRPGSGRSPYGRQPSQTGFGESRFDKPESQSGFSDSRPGSGRSPYGRQPSQTGFGESRFDKPESQSGFSDSRPGSGRSPYGRQPSQTGFGESRFDKPESQSGFSDSRPGSGRSPYGRQPSQTGFGESRFGKPESQPGFPDSRPGSGRSPYGRQTPETGSGQLGRPYGRSEPQTESPISSVDKKQTGTDRYHFGRQSPDQSTSLRSSFDRPQSGLERYPSGRQPSHSGSRGTNFDRPNTQPGTSRLPFDRTQPESERYPYGSQLPQSALQRPYDRTQTTYSSGRGLSETGFPRKPYGRPGSQISPFNDQLAGRGFNYVTQSPSFGSEDYDVQKPLGIQGFQRNTTGNQFTTYSRESERFNFNRPRSQGSQLRSNQHIGTSDQRKPYSGSQENRFTQNSQRSLYNNLQPTSNLGQEPQTRTRPFSKPLSRPQTSRSQTSGLNEYSSHTSAEWTQNTQRKNIPRNNIQTAYKIPIQSLNGNYSSIFGNHQKSSESNLKTSDHSMLGQPSQIGKSNLPASDEKDLKPILAYQNHVPVAINQENSTNDATSKETISNQEVPTYKLYYAKEDQIKN